MGLQRDSVVPAVKPISAPRCRAVAVAFAVAVETLYVLIGRSINNILYKLLNGAVAAKEQLCKIRINLCSAQLRALVGTYENIANRVLALCIGEGNLIKGCIAVYIAFVGEREIAERAKGQLCALLPIKQFKRAEVCCGKIKIRHLKTLLLRQSGVGGLHCKL